MASIATDRHSASLIRGTSRARDQALLDPIVAQVRARPANSIITPRAQIVEVSSGYHCEPVAGERADAPAGVGTPGPGLGAGGGGHCGRDRGGAFPEWADGARVRIRCHLFGLIRPASPWPCPPRRCWRSCAVDLRGDRAHHHRRSCPGDLLLLAAIAGCLAAARQAFRSHADLPHPPQPENAVLFYNPLSGGGKAKRFKLPEEARLRGIEPVELKPGDDLETLVRNAVSSGADALAMAGGDGSQAIVAMVAAEFDLPYACIPSGTRNHFALDLGVDRNDVVGALDALVDGGERRVDLAEVNGRVFVNNVSLGFYADAVQTPGYREAKLHTLLDTIPDVLGPDADVPICAGGRDREESAAAILISNNAYRLGHVLGMGTRPRLDQGELGITVLAPMALGVDGGASRKLSTQQWNTATFAVMASASVAAGIDGEAMRLQPPLHFTVRPHALRVRIAPHHPGASPSFLEPDRPWQTIESLAASHCMACRL